MKFYMEKLALENWGPFHEKTTIDFSSDDDAPVTYILGKNGAGKTMIFNALYWCLFDSPEPNVLGSIVSRDALKNGEKQMSVRLKFHVLDDYDNMTDYDVTRLLKFDVESTRDGEVMPTMIRHEFNANKYTQSSPIPQLISQKDFGSLMDNLIPPGPRQFFFLDGEKLAELFKVEHIRFIESYANAISDINLIDAVINKLDKTYNTLNNTYRKSSRVDKEIESEQKKLDRIKEEKDGTDRWKKEIIMKLEQHSSFEAELRGACADYKELKPRLDRIKEFEAKKGEMKARYDEKFDGLKKFLDSNIYLLYLKEQLEWCSNELTKLKNENEIPPKIPSDIIDDTLSTSMCMVCKRKITEEIKVMLSDIRNQIPDKKLSDDVQNFWREVDIKRRDLKNVESNLKNKLADIKSINIEINKLTNEISEEKKYVPHTLDDFDIHKKFEKLNEVTETIADLQSQLERARTAITKHNIAYEQQQKSLESKMKKNR